jgi:hypothetical protein
MRRISIFLILISFALISLASPAQGSTNIIRVVDKAHQTFVGEFRNDDLALALLPTGRLGKLLENLPKAPRTWVIDSALLDEISAMTDGYEIESKEDVVGVETARQFLEKLNRMTLGDQVIALAYGNPDVALAKRAAPSELRLYYRYGQERLSFYLNREVKSAANGRWSLGKANLSGQLRKNYTVNRQALTRLTTVVDSPELIALRARLGVLMSPTLSRTDREFFANSATEGVSATFAKLRITSGKYRVTSDKVALPITLINEFDTPVTVNLELTPLNSRVQVSNVEKITLDAKSKTQFAIPFTVIAPGVTTVIAQFVNSDGVNVSEEALLALNISVFDSKVAWFTSGAGLLLLVAAITQTVRRIRRSRK